MALPAFLVPILAQGLQLITNAALVKGKDWVKEKTGVDLDKSNLSSEDFVKLKQYEMEHEEDLIRLRQEDDKLGLEILKMEFADRDSARNMQVEALRQADVFSKRFIYYFSWFWSVACVLYLAFITFGEVPEQNIRFADTVLGFLLGTLIATIFGYFYGSSRSSQLKDETLKEVVKNVSR